MNDYAPETIPFPASTGRMDMAIVEFDRRPSYQERRPSDRREYWLIFCIAYPLLLVGVIVSRLFGAGRDGGKRRSIFTEARVAAASCIPFVFR